MIRAESYSLRNRRNLHIFTQVTVLSCKIVTVHVMAVFVYDIILTAQNKISPCCAYI